MISQLCPSAVSQAVIFDIHHLSFRVYTSVVPVHKLGVFICWCLGGEVPIGDLSPALSPFRDHLLQGQSLDPVPRPPSLPFTHLWPAVPVPASLGMKSQTELPGDCTVERLSRREIVHFFHRCLFGRCCGCFLKAFIFHVGSLIAALV